MPNINSLIEPKGGRKFSLFSGKGGVGKTTMAAATAYWLATEGYKTLIVSTDLQRSLDDIFQQKIGLEETRIKGVSNLTGITIQTGESIRRNRKEVMKTLEKIDPNSPVIQRLQDAIKSTCGCKMSIFWTFMAYLNDQRYDSIVFDTAPTGHTLEELSKQLDYTLSLAKKIKKGKKLVEYSKNSNLKEKVRKLKQIKQREQRAIRNLRSEKTSFMIIMHPKHLPLKEAERSVKALEEDYQIPVRGVIINEVVPREAVLSEFWRKRLEIQEKYIKLAKERFEEKVIKEVPLLEKEVVGLDAIERISKALYEG